MAISGAHNLPVFLLILCLCWSQTCLVQGRTVREQSELPEDQWDQDIFDTEEDLWQILCPPNNWFSKHQKKCQPCSMCPPHQFITSHCYKFHDTKCAPALDFPAHFLEPSSDSHSQPLTDAEEGSGNLHKHGGRRSSRKSDDQWRPAAVVLGVIAGVLVLALFVASVAVCVVWRRHREEPAPKAASEKLVCSGYSYSPAPSEKV